MIHPRPLFPTAATWWVTTWRLLILVAAGLIALGILTHPIDSDVVWQGASAAALALALDRLSWIRDLFSANTSAQRERIAWFLVTDWLPLAWMLLFWPAPTTNPALPMDTALHLQLLLAVALVALVGQIWAGRAEFSDPERVITAGRDKLPEVPAAHGAFLITRGSSEVTR